MNKGNNTGFFRRVLGSPMVLWKGLMGLLLVGLALAIIFFPQIVGNADKATRNTFAGLMIIYGLFRLATFYADYQNVRREEDEQ